MDVVKKLRGHATINFYQDDKLIHTIADNNKILPTAKQMVVSAMLNQDFIIKYIRIHYKESTTSSEIKQATFNINETLLIDNSGLESNLDEVMDGKYAICGVSYSIYTSKFQVGNVIIKVELCYGEGSTATSGDRVFSEKEVTAWQIPPTTSVAVIWRLYF